MNEDLYGNRYMYMYMDQERKIKFQLEEPGGDARSLLSYHLFFHFFLLLEPQLHPG